MRCEANQACLQYLHRAAAYSPSDSRHGGPDELNRCATVYEHCTGFADYVAAPTTGSHRAWATMRIDTCTPLETQSTHGVGRSRLHKSSRS